MSLNFFFLDEIQIYNFCQKLVCVFLEGAISLRVTPWFLEALRFGLKSLPVPCLGSVSWLGYFIPASIASKYKLELAKKLGWPIVCFGVRWYRKARTTFGQLNTVSLERL